MNLLYQSSRRWYRNWKEGRRVTTTMSKQSLTKSSGTNLIHCRWYLAGKSMYISGMILHQQKKKKEKTKPLWKRETVKLVCFATIQSTRAGLLHFLQWTRPASWFKSRISKLRGFVILFWTGSRGRLKRPGFTWQGFTFPPRRPANQISWRCFTRHLFSFSTTWDTMTCTMSMGSPGTLSEA